MIELDNLYNYCHQQYTTMNCQNCPNGQCWHPGCASCDTCLYDIHMACNHDKEYPCSKILYNYVLNCQSRYASEITWAMHKARPYTFYDQNDILCCSIGCGPCSEFYALVATFSSWKINRNQYTFLGFDLSSRWNDITNYIGTQFRNIRYGVLNSDFFAYAKSIQRPIDIMFVNYMLSDIMRYDKQKAFVCIDEFVQLIVSRKIKTLIINDIALFYGANDHRSSAYVAMNYLTKQLDGKVDNGIEYQKYHFSDPNEFQPTYGLKLVDRNNRDLKICFKHCPIVDNYTPWKQLKSIFLIIKTS